MSLINTRKRAGSLRAGISLFFLPLALSFCNASSLDAAETKQESKPAARTEDAKHSRAAEEPDSVVPVARADHNWMDRHDRLVTTVRTTHPDIAFFGDSITEGMNVALMHRIIGAKSGNFGIGGDRTQHLLWRLQNGELDFTKPGPRAFVILIGTNNIPKWPNFPSNTNEEIEQGVRACLETISTEFPDAKILLLGLLPRDEKADDPMRKRVDETNSLIKKLADNKHIYYADIGSAFLEPDGKISTRIMSDFLHPTPQDGYEKMFTAIKPHLDAILGKGKASK